MIVRVLVCVRHSGMDTGNNKNWCEGSEHRGLDHSVTVFVPSPGEILTQRRMSRNLVPMVVLGAMLEPELVLEFLPCWYFVVEVCSLKYYQYYQ